MNAINWIRKIDHQNWLLDQHISRQNCCKFSTALLRMPIDFWDIAFTWRAFQYENSRYFNMQKALEIATIWKCLKQSYHDRQHFAAQDIIYSTTSFATRHLKTFQHTGILKWVCSQLLMQTRIVISSELRMRHTMLCSEISHKIENNRFEMYGRIHWDFVY